MPTVADAPPRPKGGARNGTRGAPVRRTWNTPWILLGVLLVAGSSLTFVVLGGGDGRIAVVSLARDIAAGEVVTTDHLASIEVEVGPTARFVRADRRDELLGRRAVADLATGTLLTDELLVSSPPVERCHAVVGVALDPSALPGPGLRSGDPVMVVRTPGPSDSPEAAPLTVWPATVLGAALAQSTTGDVTVVSLRVDPADAPAIAAASAEDRIRLVLLASLEDIPPEALFADAVGAPGADAP